jgi:hypothetical protein
MTLRNWGRVLLTALAVAAFTGASQLGVAYGLGLVRFARTFEPGTENQWHGQLAWIAFYGMVATVVGAVAGSRALRRERYPAALGSRMLLSVAAGIGALAAAPLSMQQARAAQLPITGSPALVAGLTAGLGAVAGVLAATAVLSEGAIAWNVGMLIGLAWLTGLFSVAPSLGPIDAPAVVRLGVPDLSSQADRTGQWVAVLAMPVAALLVAAAVAGVARWLGRPSVAVALCGLSGPALLALAYLIAGPGTRTGGNDQAAPYWGSLIAVAAGLLGSTVVAVIRRRGGAPASDGRPIEPTDIIPRDAVFPEAAPPSPARRSPDAPAPSQASAAGPRGRETASQTPVPASDPPTTSAPAPEPLPVPHPASERAAPNPARPQPHQEPPEPHQKPPEAHQESPETPPSASEPHRASVPEPRRARKPDRRSGRGAAADEEYVGWVQGLGNPEAGEEPDGGGHRRLRRPAVGSGRHGTE